MSTGARPFWYIRKIPRRKFSFLVNDPSRPDPVDESIIPLKHAIRVLNGFGRSLEVILPKLRDGYIVPDPAFARNLAHRKSRRLLSLPKPASVSTM